MKHEFEFEIGVTREKLDIAERRALSAEAINELRMAMFTQALRNAMLEAFAKGVTMPRSIKVIGKIVVSE